MAFQPFHERKPVRIYFTNLPHWRQDGCTYFVTYRLADSIPLRVLEQWEHKKLHWLREHSIDTDDWTDGFRRLDFAGQRAFLKHFNRQLNTYLDEGHGSCLLRDPRCQKVIVDGWQHFHGQHYDLGALVIMPNHVHLLVQPLPGYDLEDILKSRKSYSAHEINGMLQRTGSVWQRHSYDHIVRHETELAAFQRYIAENPIKAGLRLGEYSLLP